MLRILHRKPDVLHRVLPVALGAPPLLALPRDAVQDGQFVGQYALHRCGTTPVTAEIKRTCRFQFSTNSVHPRAQIFLIFLIVARSKRTASEVARQVVGRIEDDEIGHLVRNPSHRLQHIGANDGIKPRRWVFLPKIFYRFQHSSQCRTFGILKRKCTIVRGSLLHDVWLFCGSEGGKVCQRQSGQRAYPSKCRSSPNP